MSECMFEDFISQNELFHKKLSQSDTEHKFYIQKPYEDIFLSPDFGFRSINSKGTKIGVTFYDTAETKPWRVVFHRSSADHRSHLTHNWKGFVDHEKHLEKDDVISFYKLETKRGTFLVIGVEKEGYIFGKDFNN